jgi:hypothetical protein
VTLATAAASATGGTNLATTGVDYLNASFTVTFAAGQTSATVTVQVNGDTVKESNEAFNVNITNSGAATAGTNATITIQDDESPLYASRVGTSAAAASSSPTEDSLARALEAAKAYWRAAGVSEARLADVSVAVAALPGGILALTAGRTITVDADAAGWGWSSNTSNKSRIRSLAGAQRMDLVTVLTHELGHVLGLDHEADGVMSARLAPGVRWQSALVHTALLRGAVAHRLAAMSKAALHSESLLTRGGPR